MYDLGMAGAERKRKPRNVTLNPLLVDELLSIGRAMGEENLSRLLDEAIRAFIRERKRGDGERPRRGVK